MPRHTASATDPAEGHRPASEPKPLGRVGALIAGRYRLESLIGTGAMGEVWRARHEELNTDVAVKLANPVANEELAERMLERFRFEAQVTAQLSQHTDHVVSVHDSGRHRDVPFLAMEYVPGITLSTAIDREGALKPERVAAILEQLAEALDIAHARGIWHRDIKPANIMLTQGADRSEMVKLADFGVAKAIEVHLDVDKPRTTELGMLVGTPAYMSPEQIAGKSMDARGDLWSLAVCAYEALTGKEPFQALELSQLLIAIASHTVTPPSELARLPKALDGWFARALHKRPDKRFASARQMARAFRAAIASPEERWRWVLIAAAVVTGVVVALALSSSLGSSRRVDPALVHEPFPVTTQPSEQPSLATAQPEPKAAPSITAPRPVPRVEKPAPSATAPAAPSHDYDKGETL